MVFDDLATPFEDLVNAKAAAKRFLKDGLAANDRVAIFTTATGSVLPFTGDAGRIAAAIDTIQFRDRHARSASCPLLTEYDSFRIGSGMDAEALAVKSREYDDCAHVCPAGGGGGVEVAGASAGLSHRDVLCAGSGAKSVGTDPNGTR